METRPRYQTLTTNEAPEPCGLSHRKRAELWRQFTAHLIGLATVLWWVWFREAPPK